MTADPRDTARRWLAERYREAEGTCDGSVCHECGGHPCEACVLDAILAGVEVTTILRPIDDSRRIALLLPAEKGKTA